MAATSSDQPPPQKESARQFVDGVEERLGRRLSVEELQGYRKFSEALPDVGGQDQIQAIRNFVKMVGPPLLGKPEYRIDVPLHEVLIRADEILGIEDDPDQDLHPYLKGRSLVPAIKLFIKEAITIWTMRSKDEL